MVFWFPGIWFSNGYQIPNAMIDSFRFRRVKNEQSLKTIFIMKASTWRGPGYLYVFDINGMTKFGISSNVNKRKKQYLKMLQGLPMQEIKIYTFDHYWQAELVESMMRHRLKNWAIEGRHEWLLELPIQQVLDCYYQITTVMRDEYDNCECFHYHEKVRYAHYKNFYRMVKDRFDQVEFRNYPLTSVG